MAIPPKCAVEDCIREASMNGYCNRHYLTKGTNGAKPVADTVAPESLAPAAERWSWQKWDKKMAGMRGSPTITVNRAGSIAVSAAADVMLGSPQYVELLFCEQPRAIGFRVGNERDGLKVSRTERVNGAAGFSLGAQNFFQFHGIDYSETRRWRAQLIDGVLGINMDEPPLRAVGRRKVGAS